MRPGRREIVRKNKSEDVIAAQKLMKLLDEYISDLSNNKGEIEKVLTKIGERAAELSPAQRKFLKGLEADFSHQKKLFEERTKRL